ncbi:MAG: ferrochelatase [Rubripirellula sp.]
MTSELPPYDSFLLVSFGGPEGQDDVIPFLENVLRGKNVPRERMLEVAEHYKKFGGISPINQQNRELLKAIQSDFNRKGIELPIYWGNRNWDPMLPDTLRQMRDDGRKRALAFFTSMFSCYSGCRQYRENIIAAQEEVGPDAPQIEKVRMGFNHPGFINAMVGSLRVAIGSLDIPAEKAVVLFTAHSIPMSMSDNCDYVKQLNEACRLVADGCGVERWDLVYQSRSGPPQQPWLEPDICDTISKLDDDEKLASVVVAPIGFISDHMEVLFDLDEEAALVCKERGIQMARAKTPGTNPNFVEMISNLVSERLGLNSERPAVGSLGPWHDVCPSDCCLYTPKRPPVAGGRPANT